MVESTSSVQIIVGNPTTVRGHRVSFVVSGGYAYYGVRDNVVAKSTYWDTTY